MSNTEPKGATPPGRRARSGRSPLRSVSILGLVVVIIGIVFVVAGVTTYVVVHNTLADEKISVSDDAAYFAGKPVAGPLTAYEQALTIEKHALTIGGGKTYAELPQDDPKRQQVMTASFLRASLYTSVLAFGVAALVAGLGVVLGLIGWALMKVGRVGAYPRS